MLLKGPNTLTEEEVLKAAKEELGEDPKQLEEGVQLIKEWVNKSPHMHSIKKEDEVYKMFLRGCKYSLERTKEKLDFFYSVRGNLPEWFDQWDPFNKKTQIVLNAGTYLPLKGFDKHGRFAVLMRPGTIDPNQVKMEESFKASTLIMELAMSGNIQAQVKGFVLIQDMGGMTASHAVQMSPAMAKKAMTVWQDAYPARPQAMHFLNMPSVMESLFSMVQSLQKQKMKERNHVHSKGDYSKLHENVGKDILPKEYGGNGESLEDLRVFWKKEVEQNKDWLIQQTRYKTDEKKRIGKPRLHADIFGIEGSFRKLEID